MKFLISAAIGAFLAVTPAFAAAPFFSVEGTGTEVTLPSNFNPNPSVDGLVPDTTKAILFNHSDIAGGGLKLNGSSNLVFKFMGSEAGAVNRAFEAGNFLFNENNAVVGEAVKVSSVTDGLIDFKFTTGKVVFNGPGDPTDTLDGGSSIENGVGVAGPNGANLSIAFVLRDSKHAFILFGDGTGDADYDDMIVLVSAVPLPAGVLLMLTGLGGLGIAARRKKRAAAA